MEFDGNYHSYLNHPSNGDLPFPRRAGKLIRALQLHN